MKAERRHELKENSLVRNLQQLPQTGQQYGSRIALGVILAALIFVWIRYRASVNESRQAAAEQSMFMASQDLISLRRPMPTAPGSAEAVAQERASFFADGITQLNNVLEKASDSDKPLKIQALLAKGDLNFELANFPELSGAATRPSLRTPRPVEDLLSDAADSYSAALDEHPADEMEVAEAHFGLAAVAEDQAALAKDSSKWDVARKQYQAVIDGDAVTPLKMLAENRLAMLAQFEHPTLVNYGAAASRPANLNMAAPTRENVPLTVNHQGQLPANAAATRP